MTSNNVTVSLKLSLDVGHEFIKRKKAVLNKPPPQASLSCFRQRVAEWGRERRVTVMPVKYRQGDDLLGIQIQFVYGIVGKF